MLRAVQKASELHTFYNFLCVGVIWNDSQLEICQRFLLCNIMQQLEPWQQSSGRLVNETPCFLRVRGLQHCTHWISGITASSYCFQADTPAGEHDIVLEILSTCCVAMSKLQVAHVTVSHSYVSSLRRACLR